MNDYISTMKAQIGGMALLVVGAKDLVYDNAQNSLTFTVKIGDRKRAGVKAGGLCKIVAKYDRGADLYTVELWRIEMPTARNGYNFSQETVKACDGIGAEQLRETVQAWAGW